MSSFLPFPFPFRPVLPFFTPSSYLPFLLLLLLKTGPPKIQLGVLGTRYELPQWVWGGAAAEISNLVYFSFQR